MYKLKNDVMEIEVETKGAQLISIKHLGVERLWDANPKYWSRSAPVLFPIVGSLQDNSFTINGKKHYLESHGFARDSDFTIINISQNSLTFELLQNCETLISYPFNFNFRVKYELLENELKVTYIIKNTGDTLMYYSVGGHPAFNINGIDNYTIAIDGKYNLYNLEGKFIKNKPLKASGNIKCCNESFANDAIIIEPLENHSVDLLYKGNLAIQMQYDDYQLIGFWKPYNDAPFLCLEPWNGCADFVHKDSKELKEKDFIKTLKSNKEDKAIYKIKFFKEI